MISLLRINFIFYTSIVLITGSILLSCKKKDNDLQTTPTDQPTDLPPYLPQVTEFNNQGFYINLDSFAYNDNQRLTKVYKYYNTDHWTSIYEFEYNNEGKCTTITETGDSRKVYSFLYSKDHIDLIRNFVDHQVKDTIRHILNGENQIVLQGSKDTIYSSAMKTVFYNEYSYTNGNLTEWNRREFISKQNDVYINDVRKTLFTYDNKPSLFSKLLSGNPALQIFFLINSETNYISKNNLIGMMALKETGPNSYDTSRFVIENVFDGNTKMLYTRGMTRGTASNKTRYQVLKVK